MKIIDWYMIRQFLITFLFALIAFICIFILIDLIENLGRFVDNGVSTGRILKYYLYFTPEIVSLMVPVALLLSSLFTVGRLTNLSELTAVKAGGVSTVRILIPFAIVGLLTTGFMVYFNGWVVPDANTAKANFERIELGRFASSSHAANIVRHDTESRLVNIGWFDGKEKKGYSVSVLEKSDNRIVRRWDAKTIQWIDSTRQWILQDGVERQLIDGETIIPFAEYGEIPFFFRPRDLLNDFRNISQMTFDDLTYFIDSQRKAGFSQLDKYLVTYYAKISFPFACLIVILFGVPLSSRKKRGGLALEFGLALFICFIYMAVAKVAETLGYSGDWSPLFAAWFPNIAFFAGAIVLLYKVDRV